MGRRFLLFLCLLSMTAAAQVPKTKDSLLVYLKTHPQDTLYVQALNEWAFLMVKDGNYEEAHRYVKKVDALSRKLHYGSGYYKTINMLGIIEYSKQNQKKAMDYFLKAHDLITKYRLPKKIYQNSLNNIGIIYADLGDRENATKKAMELINYQEKHQIKPLKSWPYEHLGNNLKLYEKYDEALRYYNKSMAIEKDENDFTGMAINENNIGNLYDDQGRLDMAAKHYLKGLAYAQKEDYKLLQTDFLTNLGRVCKKQQQYAKSEQYYRQAERLLKELEVTVPLKTVYQNLGDLYAIQKKYDAAKQEYLKALAISKEIQDPQVLLTINEALAGLGEATGNFKDAYRYKVAAGVYSDSVFKIETAKNSEDLLRKYETEKKEQEIKALSAKDKINRLEIENARKQRIFFLIGLGLLAIVVGLLIGFYRNKKKSAEKLAQKNREMTRLNEKLETANTTKTKLFSIIGHDLRSPISQIYQFLDLQKSEPELFSEADKTRHNQRITDAASTVLETMEDLLIWSKSQMQQFTVTPENFEILPLVQTIIGLMQSQIDSKKITVVLDIDASETLYSDRNIVIIIIRNLLQNAVKYSPENSTITIGSLKSDGKTLIRIVDQGDGIPKNIKATFESDTNLVDSGQSGLGLTLIKEMGELIGASFIMADHAPKGSVVTVTFPNLFDSKTTNHRTKRA
ncbi:tetratricopeptide repeat-containing sensor histidine kinase [Flavobacterium caeni]|uniref:histidine kinase n=1 Tax=Flavobacterium caeni TaxID=490189 RepID=A0A1G5GA50_9FLAO|nr:tetratricopeptide repeat-containing sensor histidine kinase [Flavobacterium caeni]SCY48237.1 Tetratricopeptide repeat-containing protein [Flavobacterium caeni]